jgi:hypothetical protein
VERNSKLHQHLKEVHQLSFSFLDQVLVAEVLVARLVLAARMLEFLL